MANIFISYSSEDKTIVKLLAGLLEKKGWTVWWDRQIPIGQKFDTVIENELNHADCVLVIWTKRSVLSEWVKSEANEASQQGKLIPVILEQAELPLAFRRTESALLIDWHGEEKDPELDLLFNAIESILLHKKQSASSHKENEMKEKRTNYTTSIPTKNKGLTSNGIPAMHKKIFIGLACLFLLALLYYYFLPSGSGEKNRIIRVFDWKKNPLTQGDVTIYLNEYERTQSIDKKGQALFTGLPADILEHPVKIQVKSPGYAAKIFDTLLSDSKPIELILPFTEVIFISGKVKTASEMPIKNVEVNVEGTRYAAFSITDGSYNLRLEEYTLGDEINITTSHDEYEDKTISLKLNSPEMKNTDIFLNPVKH